MAGVLISKLCNNNDINIYSAYAAPLLKLHNFCGIIAEVNSFAFSIPSPWRNQLTYHLKHVSWIPVPNTHEFAGHWLESLEMKLFYFFRFSIAYICFSIKATFRTLIQLLWSWLTPHSWRLQAKSAVTMEPVKVFEIFHKNIYYHDI